MSPSCSERNGRRRLAMGLPVSVQLPVKLGPSGAERCERVEHCIASQRTATTSDVVIAEAHDLESKCSEAIFTSLLVVKRDIGVGRPVVLQAAVELPDRRLLIPEEVDDADEPVAVVNLDLLLRDRQTDSVEGDSRQ